MDTPEVTQPDVAGAVNAALGLESAPAPETPTAPAEPPPFDPASITIPERIAESAPKALEKFKNKTLLDIAKSYEESEKGFHGKAQEAAELRRELEKERAARAAAEQFARMQTAPPQVAQQPADPYQGVNPEAEIITDPRKVLDRTLSVAERRAQEIAQKTAAAETAKVRAELERERNQIAVFNTFETAKAQLRSEGYELSDDQWREDLKYIAPVVANEGQLYNPNAYVERFRYLRGTPPKATLPKEGNPPVAAKSQAAPPAVPTVDRETRALRERFADAFGFTGEERRNYIERGGQA